MSRPSVLQESTSHSSETINQSTEPSKLSVKESLHKVSKVTFSLMEKRQKYRVIEDEIDVTPFNMSDSSYVFMDETCVHAALDTRTRARSEYSLKEQTPSKTADVSMNAYTTTISLDDIRIDHSINTEENYIPEDDVSISACIETSLTNIKTMTSYPPEIFVILKETETTLLFELPSISCEKGTAQGMAIEEQNEFYQYITVGKGRNRKMVTEETQTNARIAQGRHTQATRPQIRSVGTFVSMWEMHDTYAQLAKVKTVEAPDEMVLYQTTEPAFLLPKKFTHIVGNEPKGKKFEEISKTPEFLDAVLLTDRVLASLEYTHAQKTFRGLIKMNPLSLDLVYVYSMNELWTLKCDETKDRPVTCFSFNSVNRNILAVGYGKFAYAENRTGLICIWCTKNPTQAERMYHFPTPVTSVAFSDRNANWLGCGFANGDVIILDITSYPIKEIARSKRETNPCFEPIWCINWKTLDFHNQYLITTCQDGRINKFVTTKSCDFLCSPMMHLSMVEGKLKGLQIPKRCVKEDVPIVMYPGALCVKWHPTKEHIYYVGTDDGCVHKCSIHYLNQHISVFRAHAGPVYSLDFSPFMTTLLVTSGADGAVRMWLDGIDEVILTLNCPSAIYDIGLCPVNSTIIIAGSGNILSIWDLRRKTHMPCAEYTFPAQVVLTHIKFSPSGDNVFVGDTFGYIHTFHLEDTPLPPFYQRQLLDETIKKALCSRPHVLKQLKKIEKFG